MHDSATTLPQLVGPTGELLGFSERLPPELKVQADSAGRAAARYHVSAASAPRAHRAEPEVARIIVDQAEDMRRPEQAGAAPSCPVSTDGSSREGSANRAERELLHPEEGPYLEPSRGAETTTPGARQIDRSRRRRRFALWMTLAGLALLGGLIAYAFGPTKVAGSAAVASARASAHAAAADGSSRSTPHAAASPAAPLASVPSTEHSTAEPEHAEPGVVAEPAPSNAETREPALARARPPTAVPPGTARAARSGKTSAAASSKKPDEAPAVPIPRPASEAPDPDPPKKTDVLRNL